jgi:hypothetical protein
VYSTTLFHSLSGWTDLYMTADRQATYSFRSIGETSYVIRLRSLPVAKFVLIVLGSNLGQRGCLGPLSIIGLAGFFLPPCSQGYAAFYFSVKKILPLASAKNFSGLTGPQGFSAASFA